MCVLEEGGGKGKHICRCPPVVCGSPFLVLQQGKDGKDGQDSVNRRDGYDGLPGRRETQVFRDFKGQLDLKVKKCCRETLQNMQSILVLIILTPDNQVSQVPVWVVQCTLGGGGQCAQTSQEHNSCTLEELPEAGGAKGGGANCICLPNGPSYLQYTSGTQSISRLFIGF